MPDGLPIIAELYADDSKILADVGAKGQQVKHCLLQDDLDRASKWSKVWRMKLNFEKCKVMHFGRGNSEYKYHLMDSADNAPVLEKPVAERDLSIIVSADMKQHRQVDKAASKGFAILGQLRKAFVHRGQNVWKKTVYKIALK